MLAPRKGTFVTPLNRKKVKDIWQSRANLESLVMFLAVTEE